MSHFFVFKMPTVLEVYRGENIFQPWPSPESRVQTASKLSPHLGMRVIRSVYESATLGSLDGHMGVDYPRDPDADIIDLATRYLGFPDIVDPQDVKELATASVALLTQAGRYDILGHPKYFEKLQEHVAKVPGEEQRINILHETVRPYLESLHDTLMADPETRFDISDRPYEQQYRTELAFDLFKDIGNLEKMSIEKVKTSREIHDDPMAYLWQEAWRTGDMNLLVQIPELLRTQYAKADKQRREGYQIEIDKMMGKMRRSQLIAPRGYLQKPAENAGRFNRSDTQHFRMFLLSIPGLHVATIQSMSDYVMGMLPVLGRGEVGNLPGIFNYAIESSQSRKGDVDPELVKQTYDELKQASLHGWTTPPALSHDKE